MKKTLVWHRCHQGSNNKTPNSTLGQGSVAVLGIVFLQGVIKKLKLKKKSKKKKKKILNISSYRHQNKNKSTLKYMKFYNFLL